MRQAAGTPDPELGRVRSWRRVAFALPACAFLALVVAFAAGVSLELSRWRDAAAQQASAALGRPVAVHGALQLSLGRQLELRIGDLRISNPPGFSAAEFAAVGEATVRVDLLDLLRGQLRLRGVEASDVDLRLERASDGRGNWSFTSAQEPASPRSAIDVGPIGLRRLAVHLHDQRAATRRSIELEALSGSVLAGADEIVLTQLQGMLGEAEFSGQLTISFAAARQRLSASLSIPSLDLRPFLQSNPEPPDDAQAWQTLVLRELVPADIELDLSVGRLLGLPLAIDDAKLALRADVRGVRAPLRATLGGTGLSGQFDLDLAAPTPTLVLRLDARDLALDGLARDLPGLQGLEGTLERADLHLSGRGDTPGAVLRDLEMSLGMAAAQVSYRRAAAAPPIAFTLDTLQLEAGRGERLHGSAQVSLLGQDTRLSIRAGTVAEMLRERAMPLELELAQTRARLRVAGVLGPAEATRDAALSFDLEARKAGDLAPWLPVAPQSRLPLHLRGQVRMSPNAWFLDQTTLELGRSRLHIDAHRTRNSGRPLTMASVRSTLIDVPQLSTLLVRTRVPARAGARLDAPILAGTIDLADADLDLDLQHVWLGRTELVDVVMVARTREGGLLPSPASGKLAGAPFTALVELDASGDIPSAKLDLTTRDIDVGALLRTLGLAEDIDARAESLQLALHARGNSLRELAASTALEVRLAGGNLSVMGAAQRPAAEILMHEAIVRRGRRPACATAPGRHARPDPRALAVEHRLVCRLRRRIDARALCDGGAGGGYTAGPRRRGHAAAGQRGAADFRDGRRAARQLERSGTGGTARLGALVATRADPDELHRLRSAGADAGRRTEPTRRQRQARPQRPAAACRAASGCAKHPTRRLSDAAAPDRPARAVPSGRWPARRVSAHRRPHRPAAERTLPAALRRHRRGAGRRGAVRHRSAGRWRLPAEAAGRAGWTWIRWR